MARFGGAALRLRSIAAPDGPLSDAQASGVPTTAPQRTATDARLTWARIGRNQPPSAVNSRSQPESKRRRFTAFAQVGQYPYRSEGVVRGGVEPPTFRFSGVLSPLGPGSRSYHASPAHRHTCWSVGFHDHDSVRAAVYHVVPFCSWVSRVGPDRGADLCCSCGPRGKPGRPPGTAAALGGVGRSSAPFM